MLALLSAMNGMGAIPERRCPTNTHLLLMAPDGAEVLKRVVDNKSKMRSGVLFDLLSTALVVCVVSLSCLMRARERLCLEENINVGDDVPVAGLAAWNL